MSWKSKIEQNWFLKSYNELKMKLENELWRNCKGIEIMKWEWFENKLNFRIVKELKWI